MVEAGASEVPEAEILDALDIAQQEIKKLCARSASWPRRPASRSSRSSLPRSIPSLRADQGLARRGARRRHPGGGQARAPGRLQGGRGAGARAVLGRPGVRDYAEHRARRSARVRQAREGDIRERIAVQKKRPDGRTSDEIRPISIEVGVAPRTHGSALFTRGQTQALSVVALGTTREEMRLDTLGLETSKRYFHHYNFPPFSVGEAGFMRGPKRRDIGHGALAERALVPMIPSQEEFPYTIRVVSDILESNGSSSMASVCGSTLSLMDAGVPIKAAGRRHRDGPDQGGRRLHHPHRHRGRGGPPRRHGLQGRRHRRDGITALQMDIKITGVTFEIMRDALAQAQGAREFILGEMGKVIDAPRTELSKYAPRISTIQIDPEKIGLLIGKGGETIRGAAGGVRGPDRRGRGRAGARLRRQRRAGRRAGRPDPVDDQGRRGRRRVHRQGRQDDHVRRVRRARRRAPTACCTSRTSPRAGGSRRSRRCSTRATRSTSEWSRSTASVAESACGSPMTPRWPARASRSWRPSAPATRVRRRAAGVTAASAVTAGTDAADAAATATATVTATAGPRARREADGSATGTRNAR